MLNFRQGKRGQAATQKLLFIIIGLVLAALVSASFVHKTIQDVTGKTLEKKYLARDIALLLDTIYAAPGDLEYHYFMGDYEFFIELRNSKVYVKESVCEKDSIAGIYDYFDGVDSSKILGVSINPDQDKLSRMNIDFIKKGGSVTVSVINGHVEEFVPCGQEQKGI